MLNEITDKVLDCYIVAEKRLGKAFPLPEIKLRQMGRKAGLAIYGPNRIEINPDFWHNGHREDLLSNTVPHEVAHLIAYQAYGPHLGVGHGWGWKTVMGLFGLKPKRCHNMSLEGVKTRRTKKWIYKCGACGKELELSTTIHNRLRENPSRYHHTACGKRSALHFTSAFKS